MFLPSFVEPHARVAEAVRFHLQQQMVYGHFDYIVPEQKGFVWGEDTQESADNLLSRIYWWVECVIIYRINL